MITIEDLSSIVDNNVLNDLYLNRYEFISRLTKADEKQLNKLRKTQKERHDKLILSTENIPKPFTEIKKEILQNTENYINSVYDVSTYFDEKLYKSGVVDGIVLMLEGMNLKQQKV